MRSLCSVIKAFAHRRSLAFRIALAALILSSSSLGQGIEPPLPFDTAINPHDFTDLYYASNGLESRYITDRRTGADRWSVIGYSSNRAHSDVRVIATFPAYNEKGKILFWSPLGEINITGFTADKAGTRLRKVSSIVPIYIFPDPNVAEGSHLRGMRQAPLIDNTMLSTNDIDREPNPIGLHRIVTVRYTPAAFEREAAPIMDHFARKNGLATDKTPIIKGTDDITILLSLGYITFDDGTRGAERPFSDTFMISPVMADPTGGAVAVDAFLLMPLKDGRVLAAEELFVAQFNCLRDLHRWCTSN